MRQEERLIEYLKKKERATVRDIMLDVGINSPTKAVSLAIRSGWDIRKEYKTGRNRFGDQTRYMVYRLVMEE